jgi:hypothetical protein
MDPWWNAAVQDQACDRVHRIGKCCLECSVKVYMTFSSPFLLLASHSSRHVSGQTRAVRVYQFVMEDSIEERLLQLQESKTALGNGSLRKLTKEESKKAKITAMKGQPMRGLSVALDLSVIFLLTFSFTILLLATDLYEVDKDESTWKVIRVSDWLSLACFR